MLLQKQYIFDVFFFLMNVIVIVINRITKCWVSKKYIIKEQCYKLYIYVNDSFIILKIINFQTIQAGRVI